jgi:magnesium transporter
MTANESLPALDMTEDTPLTPELFSKLFLAVANGDAPRLREVAAPLHAADIADLLEQVSTGERRQILLLAPDIVDGEVLSELDEGLREDVIAFLPPDAIGEAVRELESDDVVDLLEDLEAPQQAALLGALEDVDRAAVEQALGYPEFSAGRLMQREVVTAAAHWDVGDAIDYMRGHDDLTADFYHVILVDPRHHPTGYVALGKLMASPRATKLTEISEPDLRIFAVEDAERDVAYAFNQYHLISAPVVDATGRLVGVVTIDDAMIVLDHEHEEDILRLAGAGEGRLSASVVKTTKQRFPWLAVNLLTSILASMVIAQFDAAITQIVALAVLMPIVASMGGNAGTQSLTVAVRALATRDLSGSNVWRVIRREVLVGLANGIIFAVIMGIVGVIWFGMPLLGVVIGVAMVVNLVVAGLAGVGVPVILERLKIDPALASGAFVTTVTDVVGFFSFLGLAVMVLL